MINEWSMRGVCEFERSVSCFFVTLTYDDDHLPRMRDGRPAFCPTHIDWFLQSIKTRLVYDGIGKDKMSYFIVSEKGSLKGRTHYHCIFYFSVPIIALCRNHRVYSKKKGPVRSDLLPVVSKLEIGYFKDLVKKFWIFGFSDIQVPRNGTAVVKYISGYVCKDLFSMDITTSKMSPAVREVHTLYRPYKIIPKSCPRDFIPGKTYNAIYTTYNFHRQSIGFGSNIMDAITPMNWLSGCMTKVIDGECYTFALPKYARDKMLRKLEYSFDDDGKRICRSKPTPLGKQVREAQVRNRCDEVCRWLDDIRNSDENLRYVSEVLGFDFEKSRLNLSYYYNSNFCHHHNDIKLDFFDYLLNKRGWRFRSYCNPFNNLGYTDFISGCWTSPQGDYLQIRAQEQSDGSLKPPLWNDFYPGYEELLMMYNNVKFSEDCAKQRKDEYDEFIKKRNKFLGYG